MKKIHEVNLISNNIIQINKKYSKLSIREFLQKLTQGIIIPIILLSFAGLFLGLGTGIIDILDTIWITELEQTKHNTAYIFPLIIETMGEIVFSNLGLLFAITIAVTFTKDAGVAGFSAFVGWVVFNAFQIPFIFEEEPIQGFETISYSFSIFFYHNISNTLISRNMGFLSLQTSLFGGVIVGFTVAWIYNKFHTSKLPTVLSFFSGTRLVPILTFLMMPILGVYFLLIYPLVAIGLNHLVNVIEQLPWGVNYFLFGTIEKSLMPFGLQDVFTSSLNVSPEITQVFSNQNQIENFSKNLYSFNNLTSSYLNIFFTNYNNELVPTTYIQGNYPITIFALPAAGIAMLKGTKHANRQFMYSTITLAIITTFLTGISEPLEFFILFWTPFLYYGFHIWMVGFSIWIMNFFGGNLEMSLYGGIISFILLGILPAINEETITIWPIVGLGVIYLFIYYLIFYLFVSKLNIQLADERTNTIYQIEQNIEKVNKLKAKGIDPKTGIIVERSKRIQDILQNIGGFENLNTIDACFTRLRITIIDKRKINQENLKELGALAVTFVGGHGVQIIFGKEADQIKTDLLTYNNYLRELNEFKESLEQNK